MQESARPHDLPRSWQVDQLRPSQGLGVQRCPHSPWPQPSSGLTSGPSCTGKGCRLRLWDRVRLPETPAQLGQSLTLASLARCSNPRSTGHGWLATGLLVKGRCWPGPGNHTLPDLLIPPDLGRLSPSWQREARNRSCGLGKRADGKETWSHFIKKGKGSPKPHALSQSAARPRAVSSWKPRDTTGLTLRKYPPPLSKYHTLKIAPALSGLAGGTHQGAGRPGDRLSPAPAGRTPVEVPAFSFWDWLAELLIYLMRGREKTQVVKDQESAYG